jgi:hypothetical protein
MVSLVWLLGLALASLSDEDYGANDGNDESALASAAMAQF